MMKSILPPLLRQCAMRRHHVIVTLMSCRSRNSNFPPLLVSVGAKAHDEKHSVRCGRPEASQKKNSTERQKAAV